MTHVLMHACLWSFSITAAASDAFATAARLKRAIVDVSSPEKLFAKPKMACALITQFAPSGDDNVVTQECPAFLFNLNEKSGLAVAEAGCFSDAPISQSKPPEHLVMDQSKKFWIFVGAIYLMCNTLESARRKTLTIESSVESPFAVMHPDASISSSPGVHDIAVIRIGQECLEKHGDEGPYRWRFKKLTKVNGPLSSGTKCKYAQFFNLGPGKDLEFWQHDLPFRSQITINEVKIDKPMNCPKGLMCTTPAPKQLCDGNLLNCGLAQGGLLLCPGGKGGLFKKALCLGRMKCEWSVVGIGRSINSQNKDGAVAVTFAVNWDFLELVGKPVFSGDCAPAPQEVTGFSYKEREIQILKPKPHKEGDENASIK